MLEEPNPACALSLKLRRQLLSPPWEGDRSLDSGTGKGGHASRPPVVHLADVVPAIISVH